LNLGLSGVAGGGGVRGSGDEFGEDPLDEYTYIAREEEQKQMALKEKAAQLAAQQKETATQQAALLAQQQAAAAAVSAAAHPGNAFAPVAPVASVASGAYVRPPPSRPPPPHYRCHNCGQPGRQSRAHLHKRCAPSL
jgi:hypothetical protein